MATERVFDIPAEVDVTTIRVPEREAICVEAGESYVTIFGDGRVCVVSSLPVDVASPNIVNISAPVINAGAREESISS